MAGPDETRAIAHSWVEAYNGKDYDRMGELLAPDMILEDVGMGLVLEGRQHRRWDQGGRRDGTPDRRLTFNTGMSTARRSSAREAGPAHSSSRSGETHPAPSTPTVRAPYSRPATAR